MLTALHFFARVYISCTTQYTSEKLLIGMFKHLSLRYVHTTQYLLSLSEGIAERRLLMNYVNASDRPPVGRAVGRPTLPTLLLAKFAISMD